MHNETSSVGYKVITYAKPGSAEFATLKTEGAKPVKGTPVYKTMREAVELAVEVLSRGGAVTITPDKGYNENGTWVSLD